MSAVEVSSEKEPRLTVLAVAHLVYGLHAVALAIGVAGAATVIGSFLGSLPSIAALILSYVNRGASRGTWVESHSRWQIRTFWIALLLLVTAWLLMVTLVGIPLGMTLLAGVTLWLIYRIVRGWLRLFWRQAMYS